MPKKLIFTSLLLLSAAAGAQNLNPEVQVTNTYVSKFSDMSKQGPVMAVPDSLHDFDYHFNYSVFESPYKGAYEFSPYSVTVKPDAAPFEGKKLYASLGAGWVLRPEIDVIWTPLRRDRFSLSVVENARGFYGTFADAASGGSMQQMTYDVVNHSAVDARIWMDAATLKIDAGYDGFYNNLPDCMAFLTHSAFASARIATSSVAKSKFHYDLGLAYRYIGENGQNGEKRGDFHNFVANGKLGGVFFEQKLSCLLDFNVVGDSFYSGFDVAPHVDFIFGPVSLRAGVRLAMDKPASAGNASMKLYPDVNASINVFKTHIQAFAFAVGGPEYNTLFGLKSENSLINSSYSSPAVTRNRLDAGAGIRGQIASRFQYDLRCGYKISESVPLYFLDSSYKEVINYIDFNSFYAKASLLWHSERFDADASFMYLSPKFRDVSECYSPSKYSGSVSLKYNFNRRVFIGADACGASDRRAMTESVLAVMPWYVDLGASLEFRINRVWSVWARGGNLMNMDIRRGPRYSEKGVSGIAGVRVNL